MARQGARRRIAKYVYADANGISGFVYLKGQKPVELRFPIGTPLPDIRRAQETEAHRLMKAPPVMPAVGTVAAVIADYVDPFGASRADLDVKSKLAAWRKACGAEEFAALNKGRLNQIVDGWLRAGTAPGTIAKRISTLRMVARQVADQRADADAPPHAVELIDRPTDRRSGEIRGRDLELVQRVLANVTDWNQAAGAPSKTKARLAVWAWTGQNPALLQQLKPEHVRWTTDPPELYLQPRRKGAGVDAGWIPLLPQAVAALKDFFAREGHRGTWNTGVVLRAFKRAIRKTQAELRQARRPDAAALLDGMTPKDLRHSIATALLERSGDLLAVKEYLRHSTITTTLRYTTGAATPRMRNMVDTLAAGFSKKNRPQFSKNFSKKQPGIGGRNAKGRHSAGNYGKPANGRAVYHLGGSSKHRGERGVSPETA